jgi:hypothetical protein
MVTVYGLSVPVGTPQLIVELQCYRENRGPEVGGLGATEHFRRAWKLMWPDYEWSHWVELLITAFCEYKWVIVIGHQRASKSYTMAHALYLDYCADPTTTLTSMGTVTFDGLKIRMWSDLLRAAETAKIQYPFTYRTTTNELRVYPAQAQGESAMKFQIHGMAMNNSSDAEGRVRGGHAPRRRLALDEAENISDPIYEAMINPMSAPDAKCVMLCNPMERISKFGQWCEPKDGWPSVSPESLMWECKAKDSVCIHLDGLQSPNVRAGKTEFTGLLTQANVDEVLAKYGENSVQWWSLIRGWFPPDGLVSRIFNSGTIEKMRKNVVFNWAPQKCASLDPAFEYDESVLGFGDLGTPTYGEKRYAINCTESVVIKYDVSAGAQPKDYQLAHAVMRECKQRGVEPKHFIMDKTGGGRGAFAILQVEWSREIQGIEYGGTATDRPLRADGGGKCEDMFLWFVSELLFRAAEYGKEGMLGGLDNINNKTLDDLGGRRYEVRQGTKGSVQVAETKKEFKKRLGRSPDHGDMVMQFGELLARLGTFPGGIMAKHSTGSAWSRHRERAKRASEVYAEN